jgi:predicted secreted protein
MATPLFSKLMSVVIDASTVACATDFSLSINKDLIEIACLDSAGGKESIPDLYSWSVSGSGMVFRTVGATAGSYSVFDMATKLLTSDASVAVKLLPDVSTNQYFSGAGYFSSLSYEGGVGAPVSFSFEITGTGTLSIATTV